MQYQHSTGIHLRWTIKNQIRASCQQTLSSQSETDSDSVAGVWSVVCGRSLHSKFTSCDNQCCHYAQTSNKFFHSTTYCRTSWNYLEIPDRERGLTEVEGPHMLVKVSGWTPPGKSAPRSDASPQTPCIGHLPSRTNALCPP